MGLFHRKSKWERLTQPVSRVATKGAAKSGLTALGTFAGVTLLSAAVSAVRQRMDSE